MTGSVAFAVSHRLGPFPAIRTDGRDARNHLEDMISRRGIEDVTIDFTAIEAMSFSFVDEFLGKFLDSYDFAAHDLAVKLAGLNEDNLYAVQVCLDRRQTQVAVLTGEKLILAGQVNTMLASTFQTATELGTFKAMDIATTLGVTPSNANNRLKKLTTIGALRKAQTADPTRGGKEFVYVTVPLDVPASIPLAPA